MGKVTRATSVSSRRRASGTALGTGAWSHRHAGFTLLELLVVLSIVALMLGLAAPAGWRAIEAARERAAVQELESRLQRLPLQAWQSGQPLAVGAAELQRGLSNWPAHWSLLLPERLEYGSNGVAKGGTVAVLVDGQRRHSWRIEPQTGRLLAL